MVSGIFEGNFRSLVTRFAAQSFGGAQAVAEKSTWLVAAAGDNVPGISGARSARSQTANASAGFELTSYRQAGVRSVGATVPLTYAFLSSPDRPFSLAGDIQYTDTQGAKTYGLSIGASYDVRVNDRWYLIPSGNFGITGSEDLGSVPDRLCFPDQRGAPSQERPRHLVDG